MRHLTKCVHATRAKFRMRNTSITCRLNTSLLNVRGKDAYFRGQANAAAAAEATALLLLSLMIPMPGARRWSPAAHASASVRNCMLCMPCVIDLRQPLCVRHVRVRMCDCERMVCLSMVRGGRWRTWCTKRASGERSSGAWSGPEARSGGGCGEVVRPPRVDCPAPDKSLSSPLSSSPSLLPPSCVCLCVCSESLRKGGRKGTWGRGLTDTILWLGVDSTGELARYQSTAQES